MPIDPNWIPPGWTDCDFNCRSPRTERDPEDEDLTLIYCECVPDCLNVGRCGCRLVRRKKRQRDPSLPDGWDLGPAEMVKITCEERAPYDSSYLYKCLCLERALTQKLARRKTRKKAAK
jgi:hypothetical protein